MLLVCFTQCASKFGKLSSGHRTGKGQLSFQFQRKKRKESESEVAQLCPTLCDPTDCSLPGSYVHGIFQARILEWVAISKKGNTKECSNYCTIPLISHASKVMLKILQARFQQYVNCEFPDVQAGFRKGRGTRDQIANIRWMLDHGKSKRVPEKHLLLHYWGLPCGSAGKEPTCNAGPEFDSWVGKIHCRRERLPSPVFWPGEFHGRIVHGAQRVRHERLHFHFLLYWLRQRL